VLAVLGHLVCERWRSPNTGTQGDASAHGSTDTCAGPNTPCIGDLSVLPRLPAGGRQVRHLLARLVGAA